MSDTFTCEMCGNTFEKGWTDEEAQDEARQIFGEIPPEEQALTCDDCWRRFLPIVPAW